MEFTEELFLEICDKIDRVSEEANNGKYSKQLESLKKQVSLCDDACLGFYFGLMYHAILFKTMFNRLRRENPVPDQAVTITYTMIPLAIAAAALDIVKDLSDKNEAPSADDNDWIVREIGEK